MSDHQKALDWAKAHIGEHETPMGTNRGAFVQSCQSATWLKGTGWPWCVATWVKAWTVAGYKLPYLGAGAYATLDWYRKHLPAWVVHPADARPGAAVIFNIGSGHLAMLESFDRHSNTVTTIGGNESDTVKRTTRPLGLVRGCVDPPENAPPPPIIAKKPVFEVVSSASGHKVIYVSGVKAISNKLPQILRRNKGGVTVRPKRPR